jgi:predicted regulator of Ras-like GTPase activity (Roadblock/LC7/MglB family)
MMNISQHDDVVVELPLNILAPLFLDRQRASGNGRRKVAIDDTIPDLFFGLPQTESLSQADSCAVTKPSDTNFLTKQHEEVSSEAGEVKTPDTNFYSQPGVEEVVATPSETEFFKRSRTPKEIVARAALLENVAGAFIALPDGLMVAGQIPPDLNGDTLAAFVPQIFNKLNQACAELRMGELNNVAFTVGNVPWKIFRVNAVFFAAFGRDSGQMPTALLAQLAGELNRKN